MRKTNGRRLARTVRRVGWWSEVLGIQGLSLRLLHQSVVLPINCGRWKPSSRYALACSELHKRSGEERISLPSLGASICMMLSTKQRHMSHLIESYSWRTRSSSSAGSRKLAHTTPLMLIAAPTVEGQEMSIRERPQACGTLHTGSWTGRRTYPSHQKLKQLKAIPVVRSSWPRRRTGSRCY